MDSFPGYLMVVNIVSFLAYILDFFLCSIFPKLDDTKFNSILMAIFPIAGGALGSLLGLFICTGLLGGHRMNKDNIAWWFMSILCLIVWALIAFAVYGIIDFGSEGNGLLSGWNIGALRAIGVYALVINVIALIAFIRDKKVAESGNDYSKRVPEAKLLGLCLIGGSVGGMVGMYAVRHKTRKWYFVWGLPAFLILQIAILLYLHSMGVI